MSATAVAASNAADSIKPQFASPGIQVSVYDSKHSAPSGSVHPIEMHEGGRAAQMQWGSGKVAVSATEPQSSLPPPTKYAPKVIYLTDQSFTGGGAFEYQQADIKDWPLVPHPMVFTLPLANEQFNVHHGLWPKLVCSFVHLHLNRFNAI